MTENVNTFLLVWTHVSRYSVNWLYCCQVYKVLTVVMYSSQISNYQLIFLYLTLFIYHWFFTLNPKELCDRIGWGIRSQLFYSYWVYGFSYQAAQVNSTARQRSRGKWFTARFFHPESSQSHVWEEKPLFRTLLLIDYRILF